MIENEAIVGASRSRIHSGAFQPPTIPSSDKTQKSSQMTSECLFHTFPLKYKHIFPICGVYTADKVSSSLIVSRCCLVLVTDRQPFMYHHQILSIHYKSKRYYSITCHNYFRGFRVCCKSIRTSSVPFTTVDVLRSHDYITIRVTHTINRICTFCLETKKQTTI